MNSVVGAPRSIPFAARNRFATPPVVRTLSTIPFASMWRGTATESAALIPPKTASFGRSLLSIPRENIVTSPSITRPPRAGRTAAQPQTLRVGLQGCEVVPPGAALVGEDRELRVLEVPDRREVLPDAGVVQDPACGRVDRRVDVPPEQDRGSGEGELVDREEVPPHRVREHGGSIKDCGHTRGRGSFFPPRDRCGAGCLCASRTSWPRSRATSSPWGTACSRRSRSRVAGRTLSGSVRTSSRWS